MNHWQLFIIISTFVYMTIAFGAYAYLTRKLTPMLPYAGAIPAFRGLKEPEKFLKLVALVVSFGWPVLLAMYGYVALIQKMGKLAGIKWDEFIDVEMMKEISKSPAKAFNIGLDNGVGASLAANIKEICFEIALRTPEGKESKRHTFIFESPEKIARILTDKEPVGEVLQSCLRDAVFGMVDEKQGQRTGEIDAEFESNGPEHVIPAVVMTRAPLEDEITKLERSELMRILYAVAFDRSVAVQALGDLETVARLHSTQLLTPYKPLEKECARARAIIDAWINMVK